MCVETCTEDDTSLRSACTLPPPSSSSSSAPRSLPSPINSGGGLRPSWFTQTQTHTPPHIPPTHTPAACARPPRACARRKRLSPLVFHQPWPLFFGAPLRCHTKNTGARTCSPPRINNPGVRARPRAAARPRGGAPSGCGEPRGRRRSLETGGRDAHGLMNAHCVFFLCFVLFLKRWLLKQPPLGRLSCPLEGVWLSGHTGVGSPWWWTPNTHTCVCLVCVSVCVSFFITTGISGHLVLKPRV